MAKSSIGQENIKRLSPARKEAIMPLRNKSNLQTLDPSLMKSSEKATSNGSTVLNQSEFLRCICMDKNTINLKSLKVVDHLHKKNCQLCGAFIINLDEEEELFRYDSGPKSSSRCDSSGGNTSSRKRKTNVRVRVSLQQSDY